MKVGWSASHSEFLIDDYYYFSKLKKLCLENGIKVDCVSSFYKLQEYDIIVFNYPEVRFKIREINRIKSWLKKGKKVVFTSYYNNFDNVSEVINVVLKRLNSQIKLAKDVITDEKNNIGDIYYPIAKWNNKNVVMPCSSRVLGGNPIIKSDKGVFSSEEEISGGKIVVFGTCVFWDNYSIDLESNGELAVRTLSEI